MGASLLFYYFLSAITSLATKKCFPLFPYHPEPATYQQYLSL
ncbi:hypothetical protein CSC16_0784 [Proteus mirabilis]|nr:hypothetical protein CSC16_0784 [Proteus mirabilis]